MPDTVIIARRFCGPPDSGNGGYSCGVLPGSLLGGTAEGHAAHLAAARIVRMDVVRDGSGVHLMAGGQLVAEARPADLAMDAPPAPSLEEAIAGRVRAFRGASRTSIRRASCAGRSARRATGCASTPAQSRGATSRRPLRSSRTPRSPTRERPGCGARSAWAALDCPSVKFGFHCFGPFEGVRSFSGVSRRASTRFRRVGDRCISVGWSLGRDGRKIHCGSALYAEDGALLAVGKATWIVLK